MVTVPTIIGAFFWKKATHWGALASLIGGGAVAIWMAFIQGVSVFNPLLAGSVAGTSVLLYVVVSLVTKPHAKELDFAKELAPELAKHRAW
jgi:SSS family solute:Na+ symporter